MNENPILNAVLNEAPEGMFGEENATYDEPYGLGTWPNATLTDVITFAASDKGFGFRLGFKALLKEGMPYTGRIDLPRTLVANGEEVEEWKKINEERRFAIVNRILATFGSPRTLKTPIDSEAQYDALTNVFRQLVGGTGGLKITQDGKNVRDSAAKSGWTFEPNGFTRVDGLRPKKK
jgi:hypothetical protein